MRYSAFINVALPFFPCNVPQSCIRCACVCRYAIHCDNRDKLDDNAIPISQVGAVARRERSFIKKERKREKERESRSREEDVCVRHNRVNSNLLATTLFFALVLFRRGFFKISNRALGRNSQRRILLCTFGGSWKRFYRAELSPHSVLESILRKKNTFECSKMLTVI